jgi:uncharacterized protein (DUF952 family)
LTIIFHITQGDRWQSAQAAGSYRTESLDTENFIHCSTAAQVIHVANKFYAGQTGLMLLCIDTDKIQAEVRFEPPINPKTHLPEPGVDEYFPHIYGALNADSVIKAVNFPPAGDGTFSLPAELAHI